MWCLGGRPRVGQLQRAVRRVHGVLRPLDGRRALPLLLRPPGRRRQHLRILHLGQLLPHLAHARRNRFANRTVLTTCTEWQCQVADIGFSDCFLCKFLLLLGLWAEPSRASACQDHSDILIDSVTFNLWQSRQG